jgi:energy-coupling factor transporter transmembrane protein EcfT
MGNTLDRRKLRRFVNSVLMENKPVLNTSQKQHWIHDLLADSRFWGIISVLFSIAQGLLHGIGTLICLGLVLVSVSSCVWTLPVVAKSPKRTKYTFIASAVSALILIFVGWWSTHDEDSLEPSDRAFMTLGSVTPLPNDSLAAHVEIKNEGLYLAKTSYTCKMNDLGQS